MITNTILNWLVTLILGGILAYIVKIYKDSKAMKQAMISLLRSQIVGKCEQCLEQDYLPDSVRLCLEDLFEQYTILGGNHGLEKLVEQVYLLPPKKKVRKNAKKTVE